MSDVHVSFDDLAVGYNGVPLIRDIALSIRRGEIITLIGPNGAGKSTILKSLIRQLALVSGRICYAGRDMKTMDAQELAKQMAVVLTQRIQPELMTCRDVVETGRYPYTGRMGILGTEDRQKVDEALAAVHAQDIADQAFDTASDGQRQRIMLARAICQEPEIIVLDEPTSYLDIRHKLELLGILKDLAARRQMTVVMSLHEIDLAMKISDRILCVKGDKIPFFGTPVAVFKEETIRELFGITGGSFDPLFGSIEMPGPAGEPEVFVLSSCGSGIPVYRQLQKQQIPFAAGILYTNDLDYHLARQLAACVLTAEPFEPVTDEQIEEAACLMRRCKRVINAGVVIGETNKKMNALVRLAAELQGGGVDSL